MCVPIIMLLNVQHTGNIIKLSHKLCGHKLIASNFILIGYNLKCIRFRTCVKKGECCKHNNGGIWRQHILTSICAIFLVTSKLFWDLFIKVHNINVLHLSRNVCLSNLQLSLPSHGVPKIDFGRFCVEIGQKFKNF
jgi:hypothetical protein